MSHRTVSCGTITLTMSNIFENYVNCPSNAKLTKKEKRKKIKGRRKTSYKNTRKKSTENSHLIEEIEREHTENCCSHGKFTIINEPNHK